MSDDEKTFETNQKQKMIDCGKNLIQNMEVLLRMILYHIANIILFL